MLEIAGGPMFAGKTTWLCERAHSLPPGSYRVFKPDIDTRYSEHECVTHDGLKMPAENLSITDPQFPEMDDSVKTILIDELNFFSFTLLLPQIRAQQELGRDVIGVGLLYDIRRQPFGATLFLSALADSFVQLYSKCDQCGKPAENTYRKIESDEQVILGSGDIYGVCCNDCWPTIHGS